MTYRMEVPGSTSYAKDLVAYIIKDVAHVREKVKPLPKYNWLQVSLIPSIEEQGYINRRILEETGIVLRWNEATITLTF